MKPRFKYSTFNKLFFGLFAVTTLGLFIAFGEKTSFEIGRVIGKLVGTFLLPTVAALITWLMSGRKEGAGNLVFNVILGLMVLGQVAQFGNRILNQQQMEEMQVQRQEFKSNALSTDDPEEFAEVYEEFSTSIRDGLKELSERSTGSEKLGYSIMSEFTSYSMQRAQAWQSAFAAIQSPRILDLSLLKTPGEYEFQRKVIQEYLENTVNYEAYFDNALADLKDRLSVMGDNDPFAAGALQETREKFSLQRPIVKPLMAAHIEYGSAMIGLIDLLWENPDEWSFENGEVFIENDEMIAQFNRIVETLGSQEVIINELSTKLIEAM